MALQPLFNLSAALPSFIHGVGDDFVVRMDMVSLALGLIFIDYPVPLRLLFSGGQRAV